MVYSFAPTGAFVSVFKARMREKLAAFASSEMTQSLRIRTRTVKMFAKRAFVRYAGARNDELKRIEGSSATGAAAVLAASA